MKKQKLPLRDFFAEYNHAKIRSMILSVTFALVVSASVVVYTQDIDTRGLMASVSNVANQKTYPADIMLESSQDGVLDVIFGSRAESVDTLTFTLLSDPEKLTSLTTDDSRVTLISIAPGAYTVTVQLARTPLYPGTKILSLRAVMSTPGEISLVDTSFESGGMRYSLTSKGK